LRLFVKNDTLAALHPSMPVAYDAVIFDELPPEVVIEGVPQNVLEEPQRMFAVLGDDGIIANVMDVKMRLPEGFKNSGIVEMTNNLSTTQTVALVRYGTGKVAAFDYLTGAPIELADSEGSMSLIDYAADFLSQQGESMFKLLSEGYHALSNDDELYTQAAIIATDPLKNATGAGAGELELEATFTTDADGATEAAVSAAGLEPGASDSIAPEVTGATGESDAATGAMASAGETDASVSGGAGVAAAATGEGAAATGESDAAAGDAGATTGAGVSVPSADLARPATLDRDMLIVYNYEDDSYELFGVKSVLGTAKAAPLVSVPGATVLDGAVSPATEAGEGISVMLLSDYRLILIAIVLAAVLLLLVYMRRVRRV
jgi:hypothetical protein